jgi:hypothetical protein
MPCTRACARVNGPAGDRVAVVHRLEHDPGADDALSRLRDRHVGRLEVLEVASSLVRLGRYISFDAAFGVNAGSTGPTALSRTCSPGQPSESRLVKPISRLSRTQPHSIGGT